jgi:hypothetical protein
MKRYLLALMVSGGLAQAQFSDVPAGHWAREAITRLVAQGVISGFPDNRFKGDNPLSRYEAALMIYRVIRGLEADRLSPADLEVLSKAMLELRSELMRLGMQMEGLVTREELEEVQRKLALLEANQQGVDLAALQELRSLLEQTGLTATQALVQTNLALERIQALGGKIEHLERDLTLLRDQQTGSIQTLQASLSSLRSELSALQQELQTLAGRPTTPVSDPAFQLALNQQAERLAAFEQALTRLEREQTARQAALAARLLALEEAQRPRFSLEGSLAWRQGFGYALGREGPDSSAERVLGRLLLSTERGNNRFGLALYSGGGVGYTAVGLEARLDNLTVRTVWGAGGEYAYTLGYRLGVGESYLALRGQLASKNIPPQLAVPRVEAEVQGQWQVNFATFSRLAAAVRVGREAGGEVNSDYLLAKASTCALESSLLGAGLGMDLPFGYQGWLRFSQLEERTPPGCPTPLVLVRPVMEARLRSDGFLVSDVSYRTEGHRGDGLGQTFTRNVLEAEVGFRFAFGRAQIVPVVGYSRIWFSEIQGAAGVWPQTELDHPGRGDRTTYRLRLGFSGRFDPVQLEAEALWRNTTYPTYIASQYGGKGALIWRLDPLRLTLEGGFYAGSNFNLLTFTPIDTPGLNTSLGWLGLRLGWPQGEVSYSTDTAGGIRFGLRYNWQF